MVMSRREFPAESCVVAEVRPSPNHGERKGNQRPDMILLHYTGMPDARGALERLCSPGSEVSAHYLVLEDGRMIQMVQESRRAWHAGAAFWAGETDINSCSIGIEIANPGHDYSYPDFPPRQIAAVTALCRGIQTRNTIAPVRVLAHSDVAPSRKQDPGEKFPWRTLWDSGVGHWVNAGPDRRRRRRARAWRPRRRGDGNAGCARQIRLRHRRHRQRTIHATHDVVKAFQRHFRPERIDGVCDHSTRITLHELLAQRGRVRTIAARARDFARSLHSFRSTTRLLTARPTSPSLSLSVGRTAAPAKPKGCRGGKSGLHGQAVPDNVRRARA